MAFDVLSSADNSATDLETALMNLKTAVEAGDPITIGGTVYNYVADSFSYTVPTTTTTTDSMVIDPGKTAWVES